MIRSYPYKIFPLGDSGITIDFGNVIDEQINQYIISLFQYMSDHPLPYQKEIVSSFSSITIYYHLYNLRKNVETYSTAYEWMKEKLISSLDFDLQNNRVEERVIRIPVCYEKEFATDIELLAIEKKISVVEIIQLHTSVNYRVYMLGFLPGFAYMGITDEQLDYARKKQPESIKAGSVGIAGRQTGIYPIDSPGGWQIIGRTPIKMFEASPNPSKGGAIEQSLCFLKAGDTVQFYSINTEKYNSIIKTQSGV
jgi:inhibitor of KinA